MDISKVGIQATKFECVKCWQCGKLHIVDSETYVKICGTVYIGDRGGLIGSAPEVSCWCIDTGCFKQFIDNAVKGKYINDRNKYI